MSYMDAIMDEGPTMNKLGLGWGGKLWPSWPNNPMLKIAEPELNKLAARIRHVSRFALGQDGPFASEKGWLYYLKPYDLKAILPKWEPGERAEGLILLSQFMSYRPCGSAVYKISLAEGIYAQIAQLSPDIVETAVAYEVYKAPKAQPEKFHACWVRLWAKAA